ncbi:MAG: terminase small subunit [Arhodomonas sp.]|nr:terminase small subunit [Arhodomonas sp.]
MIARGQGVQSGAKRHGWQRDLAEDVLPASAMACGTGRGRPPRTAGDDEIVEQAAAGVAEITNGRRRLLAAVRGEASSLLGELQALAWRAWGEGPSGVFMALGAGYCGTCPRRHGEGDSTSSARPTTWTRGGPRTPTMDRADTRMSGAGTTPAVRDLEGAAWMLTEKQARFVDEYLVDANAAQAAIRAGSSERAARAQGQRLLRRTSPGGRSYRGEHERSVRSAPASAADQTAEALSHIGFADSTAAVSPGTAPPSSLTNSTPGQRRRSGDCASARTATVQVRFADKVSALDKLARHLGLYERDNHQKRSPLDRRVGRDVEGHRGTATGQPVEWRVTARNTRRSGTRHPPAGKRRPHPMCRTGVA